QDGWFAVPPLNVRSPEQGLRGGRNRVGDDAVRVEADGDARRAGAAVTVPRGAVPLRIHAVDDELLLVPAFVREADLELAGRLRGVRGVLRRVVRVAQVHLDIDGELDHALAESDLLQRRAGVLL